MGTLVGVIINKTLFIRLVILFRKVLITSVFKYLSELQIRQ